MEQEYLVYLNSNKIGTTYLEKADAPMGVVTGKIKFMGIESPYRFIKEYCSKNKIPINIDESDIELIDTQVIPTLKVLRHDKIEIKGEESGEAECITDLLYPGIDLLEQFGCFFGRAEIERVGELMVVADPFKIDIGQGFGTDGMSEAPHGSIKFFQPGFAHQETGQEHVQGLVIELWMFLDLIDIGIPDAD